MRRLTPPAGLPASAFEALDRRLDPHADRPVAVAFSGGGDSLAALLLTKAWADRAGRPVAAITVDHGLQAASAGWTETCADLAHALGVAFQPVVWTGEKPAGGLPAAARQARHDLLARTARATGARVVVLGHTADDRLEAELMRADGSTLGELRAWSPSPVWPEGRGLFLLRPLLGLRRAALRDLLAGAGLAWIDDPANADPRFARSRARARLGPAAPDPPPAPDPDPQAAALAARCRAGADGGLSIDRSLLRRASLEAAVRFVAAAATCAAGRAGPPRRARAAALAERLRGEARFAAALAGARVIARGETALFVRDAGETARGGLAPLSAAAGETAVWDGRFEIAAPEAVRVAPLKGLAARLPPAERAALAALPAEARPALPAFADPAGGVSCPLLRPGGGATVRALAGERLRAACGAIDHEAAA